MDVVQTESVNKPKERNITHNKRLLQNENSGQAIFQQAPWGAERLTVFALGTPWELTTVIKIRIISRVVSFF